MIKSFVVLLYSY